MDKYVPFARSNADIANVKDIIVWLKVDELLENTKQLSPDEEFLIQFSGGYELAECRMYEMCVEQAVFSYKAYAEAVKRIKKRIIEIYQKS